MVQRFSQDSKGIAMRLNFPTLQREIERGILVLGRLLQKLLGSESKSTGLMAKPKLRLIFSL